jgi:hypothetical protein
VLDGIPIGLSEFFAISPGTSDKLFWQSDELVEIGHGPISYRQLGASLLDHQLLQILKEQYEPGADTGRVLRHMTARRVALFCSGVLK